MKISIHILSLSLLLSFTGCVTLYKPNTVYSPLLKAKGEINTSASVGLSGNGLINGQAAVALTDHAAIMVDGMYHHRQTGNENSSVEKLNILSGEIGAGYFTPIGIKKDKLFQCYGGAGYGYSVDRITEPDQSDPEASARYFNFFVQPGFALISKDHLELAFDLRANYVHLYNIHAYLYDQFEWWNTDFKYYADTTLNFLNLEPAVTLRVGGNNLKGVFQLGAVIPTVNSESYYNVNTSAKLGITLFKVSFGISYTIRGKQKKSL